MRKGKKQGEEDNGVVEVRELATTFPSVCTGWIGRGRKKWGCTRAAGRLRRGQWEEIDTEEMANRACIFLHVTPCVSVCVRVCSDG